jgi:hypothetical protein
METELDVMFWEILFGWILFSILIGLLGQNRKIGFWGAFLFSFLLSPIIGLLITIVSDSAQSESEKHVFKKYIERAAKAKNKEDYKSAHDNYLDAIYHLEHDYKAPNKSRMDLIISLKKKVNNLKVKMKEIGSASPHSDLVITEKTS